CWVTDDCVRDVCQPEAEWRPVGESLVHQGNTGDRLGAIHVRPKARSEISVIWIGWQPTPIAVFDTPARAEPGKPERECTQGRDASPLSHDLASSLTNGATDSQNNHCTLFRSKCRFSMIPNTFPNGSRTVAVLIPSPTSITSSRISAPNSCNRARATATSGTPQ